ncbi:MAG: TraB/GumN family protein, partial [Gammaproteobacteria bacterium]
MSISGPEELPAAYPIEHCPTAVPEPAAGTAPSIPFGSGLLFRIEKDGIAPSHIFGTIHLDDPHLQRLPPQLNVALLSSTRVVMETLTDDAAQAVFQERMRLPENESLIRWLGGELLSRFRKLVAFYRVPESLALNLKPWAATSLVGRPRPNSGRTMEDAIKDTAAQMGKQVFALETMDELIAAEEEQSVDEQVTVLVDTICQHPRIMKESVDLLELYANEDLAGIAWQNEHGHENDAMFQRMNERMLYKRSEQMVDRLQQHLQSGGVVIAIGALHLAGERGVLR